MISFKLVLNTLGKMHKTEFCLNIYTDGRNTNLSQKANTVDYALINLEGMHFVYDPSSSIVGLQWMYGANRKYGYAINISIANGTMRFYYLSNGEWIESWVK